jgi:phage-related protein
MDWTGFLQQFLPPQWAAILGVVVTIASALSNVVPSYTIVGKVLHFFALNFKSGNLSAAVSKDQNSQPGGGA